MTGHTPDDELVDLATLAADDRMLDALGRGDGLPAAEEPVAELLSAWRADLASDEPAGMTDAELLEAVRREPPGVASARHADGPPAVRRNPRRLGFLLAAAAAVIVLAALGLGISRAGPGSPLWPLVQVVQPQLAEVRSAEHAITLARTAASAGRNEEARRFLDQAAGHVSQIGDPQVAGRLSAEIDQLRAGLSGAPGTATGAPVPGRDASPSAGASAPAPAPTGTPAGTPAPGQPDSGETAAPSDPLDPLPLPLPLPPLPLPEPSSLLPSLPLPPLLGGESGVLSGG